MIKIATEREKNDKAIKMPAGQLNHVGVNNNIKPILIIKFIIKNQPHLFIIHAKILTDHKNFK